MRTNDRLSNWIINQLDKEGWSQAELARRAEVSPAQVSNVLSGERQPGLDFLQGISRAFHVPLEDVFRHAGILPPAIDVSDPSIAGLINRFGTYPTDQRQHLIDIFHELLDLTSPSTVVEISGATDSDATTKDIIPESDSDHRPGPDPFAFLGALSDSELEEAANAFEREFERRVIKRAV